MKKSATPITLTKAPIISNVVTFCLKIIIDGRIIKTGTVDIIVEAIPAEVYFKDNKQKETPKNEPKIDPIEIPAIAERLPNA